MRRWQRLSGPQVAEFPRATRVLWHAPRRSAVRGDAGHPGGHQSLLLVPRSRRVRLPLSPRHHLEHPFVFNVGGQEYKVQYLPGESNTGMFGGNSNWRGPVWMPINVLLIRALLNLYSFYGDEFKVHCPTGSGRYMTLFEVAQDLSRRLGSTFLREPSTNSASSWQAGFAEWSQPADRRQLSRRTLPKSLMSSSSRRRSALGLQG
jgi:hypothetical protein